MVAPRLTKPYREELQVCRVLTEREHPGIWRLHGGVVLHATWLLETEELAGRSHPLLTIFSPQLLNDPDSVSQQLRREGHGRLVAYVTQQIHQFRLQGEGFAMQHLGTDEELSRVWREILRTMSPEERLEGLTLEQRLVGLTSEQREQLLTLLQKQQQQPKKPKRGKKT